MKRVGERGSAMLVTLILISSLLAGAAVLVSMQLAATRSSDVTRTGVLATYCAEAGLSIARPVVMANLSSWASALTASAASIAAGTTPAATTWLMTGIGLGSGTGSDIDGDGVGDFIVYLKDNDDENPTNLAVDSDNTVFIVSRCVKYADTVKEVEELVKYTGGGTIYQSQQGGSWGNGNSN